MNDLLKQISDFRFQISEGRCRRRGVTLIELLIVISIMMLLAAFALPQLAPLSKQRKIREAARSVNVFLSRARSRAIESGRPCGVAFHRVSDDTNDPLSNAVSMLYQAEVPPPYAGDTMSARVTMTAGVYPYYTATLTGSTIQPGLLRRGDKIQINSQGSWYTLNDRNPDILYVDGTPTPDDDGDGVLDGDGFIDGDDTIPGFPITELFLTVDPQHQSALPWPSTTPLPFKILRQPVRTIAQPLTLPVETTVDLGCSGTDQNATLFDSGQDDVIIMFSPNGSVGRYYWDVDGVNDDTDATEPIYLLIGWRDLIENVSKPVIPSADIDEEEIGNWRNLSNLWIALSPQTGLITTAELASPDQTYQKIEKDGLNPALLIQAILETRQYARRAQSKGGR